MGFMVHVCAGLLLVGVEADDLISHINAVSFEKVKGVEPPNTNLVPLVGFRLCRNMLSERRNRTDLWNKVPVKFSWHWLCNLLIDVPNAG